MNRFASVVLAVIVLLGVSMVLYPVVAGDRIVDYKVTCLSRIKQSAIGLIIYSSDYSDRFPDRDRWIDATLPYTKSEEVYRCPDIEKLNPKQYGFAFNSQLSFAKVPAKDPDTVPLVYDSVNLSRNASDPVTSLPDPPRHKDGKINYMSYADGHAKALKKP